MSSHRLVTVSILGLAAALAVALVAPARADEDRHDRDHHEQHDRDWYRRHHRPAPVYVAPTYEAPVYAPPAVIYTPPMPVGGINLIIPFNFR